MEPSMADRGTIIVTARVAYSCDYNKYSDLKFFSELRDGYRLISVILIANFPFANFVLVQGPSL